MLTLPVEIRARIFKHTIGDDVSELMLVCKTFNTELRILLTRYYKKKLEYLSNHIEKLNADIKALTGGEDLYEYDETCRDKRIIIKMEKDDKLSNDYRTLMEREKKLRYDLEEAISTLPANIKHTLRDKVTDYGSLMDIVDKACKLHRGFVFMYPNGITFRHDDNYVCLKGYNRDFSQYMLKDEIPVVPCWIHSRDNDNWPRHYYEVRHPEYMPLPFFIDKKEGDSIEYVYDNNPVKLTLLQKPYRYGPDNFHDLLRKLATYYVSCDFHPAEYIKYIRSLFKLNR